MYTSYSGMRSTGGGVVPSARRFRRWVLVATPSLGTLMQLPVGIVLLVLAAGPLLPEPGVEARWHEAIGSLLPLGGAGREKSAYSFFATSSWPRTHSHITVSPWFAWSSFCHSSRFSTSPPLRFHPRAFQPGSHSVTPLTRYSESE